MQVVRTPVSLSDVAARLNLEPWIVSNYFKILFLVTDLTHFYITLPSS